MKYLILLLLPSLCLADCTSWRGTVYQVADDGTFTTLDTMQLLSYDVSQPVKTFTYTQFLYATPVTVNVTMPLTGWGWFSVWDEGCQFSLAYQVSQVVPMGAKP